MKYIKNLAMSAMLCALVLSVSSCGTVTARMKNYGWAKDDEYYKGVSTDVQLLGANGDPGYETLFCYLLVVCPIAALVSIPIDLAIDTVLLPYDYLHASRKKSVSYAQARLGPSYGFVKYDFSVATKTSAGGGLLNYRVMYTGKRNYLRLSVDDVPGVSSTSRVFVPLIEGYKPHSIDMYYGSLFEEHVTLYFKGESESFLAVNRVDAKNDDLLPSGKIFTCGEDQENSDSRRPKIVMTPYFKGTLQIVSVGTVGGRWSIRC